MASSTGLPKVIRVSPHDYYVTEQEDLLKAVELVGQCDNESGIIRFRQDSMSDNQVRETILHECLHACVYSAGIRFEGGAGGEGEEGIVNRLTPRLLGVLQENPKLVKWLMGW